MAENTSLKSKASYIFAVAAAFILYQLYLVLNSFPALSRMYSSLPSRIEVNGTFWPSVWFSSEVTGTIGLIIRFAGACLFVAFALLFWRRKKFSPSLLRRAVLLEGTYYLFYIPFILYLFTRPASSARSQTVYYETAVSYTIQTIIVFSTFILLYFKTRRTTVEKGKLLKFGAVAAIGFAFALWVKHLLFNLYALPINTANPTLAVGLLNSVFTMLFAALILLYALLPIIREQKQQFSSRAIGTAFILIGAYFIIYILVALADPEYMVFLTLTELWAIAFTALGAGFFIKPRKQIVAQ